jgi:hypothetical protein
VRPFFIVLILSIPATVYAQQAPVPNDGTLPPAPPSAEGEPADSAAPADKSKPAADKPKSPADELSVDQARLADRFKRLEEVVGRLAELSASTDPRRAKLLREAIAQSREQDVNARFESIVKLLQDERLSAASTNQTELQKELDSLLNLLLKADRDKELSSQRERIRKYLKEVDRIIRMQKGVRARTEGGDEIKGLGSDQQRIAADTGKLGGDISRTDGDKKTPSDSPPKPPGKDEPKPGDKEKPKSNDQEQPKPGNKDKPKSDGNQTPGKGDADKPSKPGDSPKSDKPKPDDKQQPGDKQDSGKPSDGKPQSGQPKPGEDQPSQGKPSKPGNSPPSDSPPQQGKPGSQSDDENNQQQPPQPQEPADRAARRLKQAQDRMEQAQKKLEQSIRKAAIDDQNQAIKELERAKAELERVLRQLREEELERTLTQLSARFRKMLELQTAVYEGTVRLDKVPEAERTHDHEIESARLSRQESQIVHETDKALLVLHEDASSVAFPEAIEQMRDDMRQVTDRLAALKVEKVTQALEKDIIAALEEAISAFEQSRKDLEKKKTPPGQRPAAGQPEDMALVERIQELKMIRSLQMRINNRTKTYGEMIEGDQAETPDLLKALEGLAERQERVYKAAADLYKTSQQQGRN